MYPGTGLIPRLFPPTYSAYTVWCLYFAGLNFRELLFENISLKKFAISQ